jgi:hypothetical protein
MQVFGVDLSSIMIEQWDEFVPGNDEIPYAFVAELYEMRREAKSKKEYDIYGNGDQTFD